MADQDTLTGQTPAETYTKLVQVNEENVLMDGIGTEFSPIMKAGAVVTGSLKVEGPIISNGVEVGTSTDSYWNQTAGGELVRNSNVSIGESSNPEAKLEVNSNSTTEDFFIVKKTTNTGGGSTTDTVFKINNEGTMVLGGQSTAPTATEGAIYYDSNNKAFYLGEE